MTMAATFLKTWCVSRSVNKCEMSGMENRAGGSSEGAIASR